MKERKTPMRMCTGCGEMKPKRELVRVVRSAEGNVSLDLTGKANGRGAYICRNVECLKKAQKSKRIDRAFAISIPEEIYDRMSEEIGNEQ